MSKMDRQRWEVYAASLRDILNSRMDGDEYLQEALDAVAALEGTIRQSTPPTPSREGEDKRSYYETVLHYIASLECKCEQYEACCHAAARQAISGAFVSREKRYRKALEQIAAFSRDDHGNPQEPILGWIEMSTIANQALNPQEP